MKLSKSYVKSGVTGSWVTALFVNLGLIALFGVKQVWNYLRGNEQNPPEFMEPGFYKYVRHPLMLGFLIAFWSVPHMTASHLLFSAGITIYILIGVYFEEKSMARRFGDDYEGYRERVPKFFLLFKS